MVALFTQVGLEVHSCTGEMVVAKPNLWWPHLMAEQPGHMMTVGFFKTGGEHYYVVVLKLIFAALRGIVFVVSDQLTDFS